MRHPGAEVIHEIHGTSRQNAPVLGGVDLAPSAHRLLPRLPYAGGSATCFRPFVQALAPQVEVLVARRSVASGPDPPLLLLPGRRAPTAVRCERPHEAGERELLEEVSKLSDTRPALPQDPELKKLLFRILHVDHHVTPLPGNSVEC